MSKRLSVAAPRQETFEFTRRSPQIPKAVLRECRTLLVELLVGVLRVELENGGSGEFS